MSKVINIYIIYGYHGSTLHPHDFGFIVLIDDNFNILEILTEYYKWSSIWRI